MLSHARPIRLPALRDALGLARLLYAVESRDGADAARLAVIAGAGKKLRLALDQAQMEDRTLGRRAAHGNAEHGFQALLGVTMSSDLHQLVEEAKRRTLEPM